MPDTKTAFIYSAGTDARSCPVCHRVLEAFTGVSLDPHDTCPQLQVGSVTGCAYCGVILVVTTIGFRLATEADLSRLAPELQQLIVAFANRDRGPVA